MYIVLTGDLKSSKKIEDRSIVQNRLREALNYVNDKFYNYVVAKFKIIGGDGFQGMISSPDIIFDIYFVLFEKIKNPFYLGIGIEGISTRLSQYVEEIDGKAFHYSSEGLETAKKKRKWVIFRSNLLNNNLFECILNLSFEIMWNWTQRRKEIIMFYREHGENSLAIEKASFKFKIGVRNVYKALEAGKYSLLKYAENIFKEELSKDWSEIDPISDQF